VNKITNKIISLMFILVVGIMVSGCSEEKAAEVKKPITITMHLWPGYAHSYIALEKGFFKEEGVDVELNLIENIQDNIAYFLKGKADLAFGLQSDAMRLAAQGFDIKIIYIADFSNGGDTIVSKKEIKNIVDLKGKTVSVDGLNSFNHIFLVNLLELNGLTEEDVKIIPIPASEVHYELDAGTIDAGQTWNPYYSEAISKGYRLLASTANAPGIVTDVLMIRSNVLEERPEDVRKVIKALFKALKFRETDEIAAYAIMSEAFNVPVGELRETIRGNIFPDLEQNKKSFEDSEELTSLYASGKFISDFYVKKGIIPKKINLDELHAPGIVNEIES